MHASSSHGAASCSFALGHVQFSLIDRINTYFRRQCSKLSYRVMVPNGSDVRLRLLNDAEDNLESKLDKLEKLAGDGLGWGVAEQQNPLESTTATPV